MEGITNLNNGSSVKIGEVTLKDKSTKDNFLLCDGNKISKETYSNLIGILPEEFKKINSNDLNSSNEYKIKVLKNYFKENTSSILSFLNKETGEYIYIDGEYTEDFYRPKALKIHIYKDNNFIDKNGPSLSEGYGYEIMFDFKKQIDYGNGIYIFSIEIVDTNYNIVGVKIYKTTNFDSFTEINLGVNLTSAPVVSFNGKQWFLFCTDYNNSYTYYSNNGTSFIKGKYLFTSVLTAKYYLNTWIGLYHYINYFYGDETTGYANPSYRDESNNNLSVYFNDFIIKNDKAFFVEYNSSGNTPYIYYSDIIINDSNNFNGFSNLKKIFMPINNLPENTYFFNYCINEVGDNIVLIYSCNLTKDSEQIEALIFYLLDPKTLSCNLLKVDYKKDFNSGGAGQLGEINNSLFLRPSAYDFGELYSITNNLILPNYETKAYIKYK